MEIEIGDYVRTSDGKIGKFIRIEFDEVDESLKWYVFLGKDKFGIEREIYRLKPYIVAHSKNIIDLLEEGDFVNGMMIEEFADYEEDIYLGVPIYTDALMNTIEEVRPLDSIEIETILTKEQYMNNCYVVKE